MPNVPEWAYNAHAPDPVRGPAAQVYDPDVIGSGTIPLTPGAPRDTSYLALTPAQRSQFQRFQYDYSGATVERLEQDTGRLVFQEGSPPNRVPWLWKDNVGAWAGLAQHGFHQWYDTLYLRPPLSPNFASRERLSMRGITQRVTTFTGVQRIPAVYVPTSVG